MPTPNSLACDFTGVGVEVIRRAFLELGTAAELNAEIDGKGGDGHADGEPTDNFESP